MQSEYSVLSYRVDLYFHDYKLAIEVDEFDNCERDNNNEEKRDKELKEELVSKFIRINPDEENFIINKTISEIHRHIKQSSKNLLTDKISRRLLSLEFRENHSIKSKCFTCIVKKYCCHFKMCSIIV